VQKIGYIQTIIAALLLASPAQASRLSFNIPPTKETCVGILSQNQKGFLFLDTGNRTTDEHLPKWIKPFDHQRDIVCTTLMTSKSAMAKVLRTCTIGQGCGIKGMIKGYSHDIFEWVRVDNAFDAQFLYPKEKP